jgi:hypothetical protein
MDGESFRSKTFLGSRVNWKGWFDNTMGGSRTMRKKNLCTNCNQHEAKYKSRQLCYPCHRKLRQAGMLPRIEAKSYSTIKKIKYLAEIQFVQNYPTPKDLIYQPGQFRFNGTSYQPDFYDFKKDIFYEIIGTRQAFDANKRKIEQFRIVYPKIRLEIIMDYQRK